MSTEKTEVKKRRGTSIPLLVGFLILGACAYLFGEKIMTYAFYLQEAMLAKSSSQAAVAPEGAAPPMPMGLNGGSGAAPGGPAPGGPEQGESSSENTNESSASEPSTNTPSPSEPSSSTPSAPAAAAGGPSGTPDPEGMFAQRDKDSNGKLEGDEISERMQARLTEVDTDNDKAVSKDEFLTAWRNRQSSGGTAGAGTQRPASDSAPAAETPQPGEPK